MPAAWSGADYSNPYDWSLVDNLVPQRDALIERYDCWLSYSTGQSMLPITHYPFPAVIAGEYPLGNNSSTTSVSLPRAQNKIFETFSGVPFWYPPDGPFTGTQSTSVFGCDYVSPFYNRNPFGSADFTSLRDAAGLPPAGGLFRQVMPRRVYNLTDTTDIWGNAAADGQKAYWYELNPITGRQVGDLVKFDGASSTWKRTATGPVDAVDTAGTAPDFAGGGGIMGVGDYMGEWILNEYRAICNVLVCMGLDWEITAYPSVIASGSETVNTGSGSSSVSFAAALANAQANYDANTPGTSGLSSSNAPDTGAQSDSVNDTSWTVDLQMGRIDTTVQIWSTTGTANFALELYWFGIPYGVMDANGLTVADNEWTQVYAATQSLSVANDYTQFNTTYGPTVAPGTYPDVVEAPARTEVYQGWQEQDYMHLARFDVTGGFKYQSSTP